MDVPEPQSPQRLSTIIRQVLSKSLVETIVSYPGTSQYTVRGAGTAACGLAALNFARVTLLKDQQRLPLSDPLAFLTNVLSQEAIQEATSICSAWTSSSHMEVESIIELPLFSQSMKLAATKYGVPDPAYFRSILADLVRMNGSAVVIVTRPPEIVACVKLKLSRATHIFLIFDSHPREKYPDGTGIIITSSVDIGARRLAELLPVTSLLETGLEWQAQLLSNCSGHIFVPHDIPDENNAYFSQVALESSLALLSLRAEVASLNSRIAILERENLYLESQVQNLKNKSQNEASRGGYCTPQASSLQIPDSENRWYRNLPSGTQATSSKLLVDRLFDDASVSIVEGVSDTDPDMDNYSTAVRQQRIFDAEDQMLRRQQHELMRTVQKSFDCQVCLDTYPEDLVLRVDACRHGFCRDCMKGFIASKIGEHRFPILCPVCTAAQGRQPNPGEITHDVIMCVDLEEEQYAVWIEMQMAKFSTLLHCRKCAESVWVDKTDLSETSIIVCPLRGCGHVWCKDCQQTIEVGSGPRHSCDGSAELDHLVKTQGWSYCPTCRTPVQKSAGCNHMTCIAPGCNTHFCYRCGGLIVQSALRDEIRDATSSHYAQCQLFEVPA